MADHVLQIKMIPCIIVSWWPTEKLRWSLVINSSFNGSSLQSCWFGMAWSQSRFKTLAMDDRWLKTAKLPLFMVYGVHYIQVYKSHSNWLYNPVLIDTTFLNYLRMFMYPVPQCESRTGTTWWTEHGQRRWTGVRQVLAANRIPRKWSSAPQIDAALLSGCNPQNCDEPDVLPTWHWFLWRQKSCDQLM